MTENGVLQALNSLNVIQALQVLGSNSRFHIWIIKKHLPNWGLFWKWSKLLGWGVWLDGAADPTMDLWLETDSHIFFDSVLYSDSAAPRKTCVKYQFKVYSKKQKRFGSWEFKECWSVKMYFSRTINFFLVIQYDQSWASLVKTIWVELALCLAKSVQH